MNLFKQLFFNFLRFIIFYVPDTILYGETKRRDKIRADSKEEYLHKLKVNAEKNMAEYLANKTPKELEELTSTICEPFPAGHSETIVNSKKRTKKIPLAQYIDDRPTQR